MLSTINQLFERLCNLFIHANFNIMSAVEVRNRVNTYRSVRACSHARSYTQPDAGTHALAHTHRQNLHLRDNKVQVLLQADALFIKKLVVPIAAFKRGARTANPMESPNSQALTRLATAS